MVYLKKIETRGFKSLGAKLVSTPIEQGFVAITGPNGSGKSNLIDAILFALGENSARTLRVSNLSSLIYDGSVEEQKPSSARVSLQFDNSDRRIPIDSDSLTLSRELKQSGESIYSLNGKHTQRNTLLDLLENALIASRGLNVVLQGMIMRISDLVPDEKRKLIEQMVGIAQFDEKKTLALQQLKEADVKLEVAMAKIGEIRDRVQLLELQRNDMLRVRQLDEQITWLRAAASSTKLGAVRYVLSQRRDALVQLKGKIEDLQGRAAQISSAILEIENQRNLLIKSAMETGTAQIELELGKIASELNGIKREREEATDFLQKTHEVLPALAKIVVENQKTISQREEQISFLEQQIQDTESSKLQVSHALTEINAQRSVFETEFTAAQGKIDLARREKQDADSKLQTHRDEYNALISALQSDKEKLVALQEKIQFFEDEYLKGQKSIDGISSILVSQKKGLLEIKESKQKILNMQKKIEQQLEIATLILQRTQNVITKFDSDLSAMESVAGEEIALARLESLGSERAIPGYLGPLRTLISYDLEYSQAVAAVGKEWLNAIVVEDMDALIRITEAARKLKITKLIAIPLSEVTGFEKTRPFRRFEGMVGSVPHLIRCGKNTKRIINFVFGDVVIVDSPKNAFIAAKRGFRAVTLRGDVFEPEILAFQTGYSQRYAKLSDLLSKQEGFDSIKDILGSFRTLIEKRRTTLDKLEAKSENYSDNEQETNVEISRIESKLETSQSYLQKQLASAEHLKSKVKDAEAEIARLNSALLEKQDLVNHQMVTCQEATARLENMSLAAFNQRLTDLSRKEHDITESLEKVTTQLRDLTTDLIRSRADLENNLKKILERNLQQQSQLEAGIEAKNAFLKGTEAKLHELEGSYLEIKKKEQESLEKTGKFQPMLDALDQKLKSLRADEESVRKSISTTERELVTANLDVTRMTDSERQLLGELAMFGYAEPIEAFEGAESLGRELESEYSELKNNVNLIADKNYREIFENYKYSSVRKNDLEKERNAIVTFIETIDSEKRRVFMDAFERIDKELRVIFNKITDGAGWLEIENPDAMFESGIFLMTQFPGKLPRDSSSVSGGEKTISALSFILAIQAVFPSPFYVFDEVDAHLDSNYSGKLADILAERSDRSQIIIVSLKDNVVAKASSVIGVYMSQGSSRVLRYRNPMEIEIPNEQPQQ
jgi:chromosome segregation protein